MSDEYAGRAVYEQEVTLLLTEKFTSDKAQVSVTVAEMYSITPEIEVDNGDELVAWIMIRGLNTDSFAVAIVLGGEEIEDVTKTPQDVAQMAYGMAVDALRRRGQQDSE